METHMSIRSIRRSAARRAAASVAAIGTVGILAAACTMPPPAVPTATGPSTSTAPYLLPQAGDVSISSILTVGDSVPGTNGGTYRMAGIPDGLGVFDNNDGTMTVLMNHELGNTVGVVRAHGAKGAFVSKWIVRKSDLTVVSGSDLATGVSLWDSVAGAYGAPAATALARLCSGDLAPVSGTFNSATGAGTQDRIMMNGEETGAEGRAFGFVATGTDAGTAFQLAHLGRFSWENSLVQPFESDTTSVIGTDDTTPGQVYLYTGTKRTEGNAVEKAGLVGGTLAGISVQGLALETDAVAVSGPTRFTLAGLGDVSAKTGAILDTESTTAGVTKFQRPEDGVWDPRNPADFYFATTASFGSSTTPGISRIWRLRFDDASNLSAGGTAEVVLNGAAFDTTKSNLDQPGPRMIDNITMGQSGDLILQEDPGNQDYVANVWQLNPETGQLRKVLQHDSALFAPGAAGFLTKDEESSGIVPLDGILGTDQYLLVDQVHLASADPELVEGGQFLTVTIPGLR